MFLISPLRLNFRDDDKLIFGYYELFMLDIFGADAKKGKKKNL